MLGGMAAPLRVHGSKSNREAARVLALPGLDMERGRRAPTERLATPAPPPSDSPYPERLLKLIPAEVIAIYRSHRYLPVRHRRHPRRPAVGATAAWAATCLLLVVIARGFTTRDAAQRLPPQWPAVIISALSFVIWIFTMPGLLQGFGLAPPFVGSLIIAVWTFLIPYVYKRLH